jgi:hypothetical protein
VHGRAGFSRVSAIRKNEFYPCSLLIQHLESLVSFESGLPGTHRFAKLCSEVLGIRALRRYSACQVSHDAAGALAGLLRASRVFAKLL